MTPSSKGSFRIFSVGGISVFMHWSWFVVAILEVNDPVGRYRSLGWNAAEYFALFGMVLMHEFGHALACRSVGGDARQIVLWPLGGVAYVNPPMRPGAMLCSIAAGPLVNVALGFLLTLVIVFGMMQPWWTQGSELRMFLLSLWVINAVLLAFNLLPVYPLDGGKILWSLLWFFLGCGRALAVASVIGIVGVIGLLGLAVLARSVWLAIIGVFVLLNCWGGLLVARQMLRRDSEMPPPLE
ncbi:MAG: M50 family metallopeptidase [Verrucomicrobiae bacterium]|nr:M50 family metallopeptidase [Verrucomicrobiae bacterium]